MLDLRPVLFINGFLLLILAASMGLPAAVDAWSEDLDWEVFLAGALATGFCAGLLILGSRPGGRLRLETRSAFLLTVSAWVVAALCAALPFVFSVLDLSFTDSVFEAMSGLTTSGATVIVGLDHAPKGILLWRALLNWLGGLGIAVMAVAILPLLRIGGMQLFKMESSDKTEKVGSRVSQVAASVAAVYAGLTLVSALAFWAAGMGRFDALCHAMSALSTGGFSTSDESLGHWGPAVRWVAVASMILGGAPFPLFVAVWKRRRTVLWEDSQFKAYLGLLAFFAALLGIWRWASSDWSLGDSLREATFGVVSVVTTTGFVTGDMARWGGFAHVAFFLLTFVGGCTGSTAGAIKVFRWQVLSQLARVQIKRLLHPHGVFVIDYNRRNVSSPVVDSVLAFVILYIVIFAIHAVLLTMTGMGLVPALSASASALGNGGPGVFDPAGAAVAYRGLPDVAKWILAFEMLIGRLELFPMLVLFSSFFWRE